MAVFHTIRKLKNSKRSEIATNSYMSDSNGSETNPIVNNHEINIDNESKTRIPSQKKLNEQIRNHGSLVALVIK